MTLGRREDTLHSRGNMEAADSGRILNVKYEGRKEKPDPVRRGRDDLKALGAAES